MKYLHALLGLVLALFSAATFAQAIDINTATAEQLDKALKGIGPAKAAEIVKYREANGPFKSVEDLTKVPGIGEKTLSNNKDLLMVGGAASGAPGASKMPAMPAAPSVPATPTRPAAPTTVPAKPAMPATPSVPATPAMPTAPTVPPVAPPKQ